MYQQIKITIDGSIYFFSKPKYLFHENKLYIGFVNGSQMSWKIKNKLISYNQIKKLCQK